MGRKKKYENALIVKGILSREAQTLGNTEASIIFRFLDLKKKDDRECLKRNIIDMMDIFESALKELEDNNEGIGTNEKRKTTKRTKHTD